MATSASSRKTDKFRTPTKGCTGRTTRRCGPFCVPAQRRERQQPERETQAPDAPTHCRKTETAGRDSGLYSAESTRVLAAEYSNTCRKVRRRPPHGATPRSARAARPSTRNGARTGVPTTGMGTKQSCPQRKRIPCRQLCFTFHADRTPADGPALIPRLPPPGSACPSCPCRCRRHIA